MIGTVGPKGQVVIPKAVRDALGIRPGGTVDFRLRPDGVLEVRSLWHDPIVDGPAAVQALRHGPTGRATDELLTMRREDEALWEARFERWQSKASSSTRTPSSRSSTTSPARKRSARSSGTPKRAGRGSA
jgi:AbrB family looped-hinge helix DNA binding protein